MDPTRDIYKHESRRDTTGESISYVLEDVSIVAQTQHVVYATRTSDGEQVCIKRVVTGSSEARIVCMLSSVSMVIRGQSENHAVPVFTAFEDEENVYITYLVMPLLRHIDDSTFMAVGDVVDFVDQLLEVRVQWHWQTCSVTDISQGLAFLHKNGVAHRYIR